MGVKIRDIADKLGVSPGTVSKALNDRKGVGDKLKAKIKRVAKEMEYHPNPIARRLSMNKSNTIGVFILSRDKIRLRESFAIEILDGVAEEANKRGYDILLFTNTSSLYQNVNYLKLCKERRVEGAIFFGLALNDPELEEIKQADIPVAIIDLKIKGENIGYISSDNPTGINQALDYLTELGHQRVGFFKSTKEAEVSEIRFRAYQDYLLERNLYNPAYVWEGDFTKESGERLAQEVLSLKQRPTAILSANDSMALGAMGTFKAAGLKIPDDISLVGFDNMPATQYTSPKLTTINQDGILFGKEAVNFILNKLNANSVEVVKEKLLKPELIIRNSVKDLR
jgi:DNA-binding LacI/PurR family transcriptional regulator